MKKYNLINNLLGWACFAIAAVTYLLTVEPTASFWDCPEFIAQGFKLEVGHPPGNPIFMLAARFFVNFTGGDVTKVALAVNSMSALLSAGTILLLFWTITHLVRRLITKTTDTEYSPAQMVVIFASGLVGALAYTWSDTFWFSAVEGEVYAFSSFCTALVFWLILKWENRADQPHSDRYLILIAYVIGISIAVHLLNLLCIPAIVLVFYYKKFKNITAKGSLVALCVSFVIVALILYGLVPGFIEVAQYFELLTVNVMGWSYNSGVLVYTVLTLATFIWALCELYRQRSATMIKLSFMLSILFSGIPFIGSSLWIPVIIMIALIVYMNWTKKLPIRILNIVVLSVFVIFIGYSSYALLLIRSSAATPMNQNAPDNVFDLASYLNREQYGERPLLYGQTFTSDVLRDMTGAPVSEQGEPRYAKAVKHSHDDPDRYEIVSYKKTYRYIPELNMLFPRLYDTDKGKFQQAYLNWTGIDENDLDVVNATLVVDKNGDPVPGYTQQMRKPTFAQNLRYFINYQLVHMYLRYFMWNFAGRQNDIQGNGEVNRGNWISGIPAIDTPRLGDQSLLPDEWGKGNKGHNVFYMLPLLLGIIGLLWQAFYSQKGIEQFWVIFFLFFMTGIAIVLYLNQTPNQPRERDYAFAGSFYAFAIWIGVGVAALWRGACRAIAYVVKDKAITPGRSLTGACIAAVLGMIVPLQMVSQTWDDHDRSGRYTTRDYGMNYLSSLDENAIIFTNGDNDTFPLWYAQEVEGYRTDVRVVNLSYLTTDWYANQQTIPSYDAPAIDMLANPEVFGQDKRQYSLALPLQKQPVPVLSALKYLYSPKANALGDSIGYQVPSMPYANVYIPVDIEQAVKAGRITPEEAAVAETSINIPLVTGDQRYRGMLLSEALTMDFLATSVANGWNRPIYFAMTVPSRPYYIGLDKYMRNTGLAYEVGPVVGDGRNIGVNTDKMYRNVTERFRWGGLDEAKSSDDIYLDETVRRMVTTHRSALLDLAMALYVEGAQAEQIQGDDAEGQSEYVRDRYTKALDVLRIMDEKLPEFAAAYGVQMGERIANLYGLLADALNDEAARARGIEILENELHKYADFLVYYQSLKPWQYASLQTNDQYVRYLNYGEGKYESYFEDLLEAYIRATDAERVTAMIKDLDAQGVDLMAFPLVRGLFEDPSKKQPQCPQDAKVVGLAS